MSLAEYKRDWRKKAKQLKRFNKPLGEFLKLKHVGVYDEYCEFFKTLDQQNPSAKDLTKTHAFKVWKENLKQEEEDENITTCEAPITLNTYFIKDPEPMQSPTIACAEQEIIYQAGLDPLSEAVQDVIVAHNIAPIDINQAPADDIIDQIINELEQEEALQPLLNEENDEQNTDEGIGLNLEDEVGDVFDFDEEVDFYF